MDKRIIIKTIVVGPLQTNCYILASRNTLDAVLIDPGDDIAKIKAEVKRGNFKLKAIILTHGHYDHIGCLDDFDLPVYVHADDAEMLLNSEKNLSEWVGAGRSFDPVIKIIKDNDVIPLADLEIKVLHTPGHTRGGICLQADDVLFSGDTLFCHGVGRTDLPGGSFNALLDSINNKLMPLDPQTRVLPGHGPATTIKDEKQGNSFL